MPLFIAISSVCLFVQLYQETECQNPLPKKSHTCMQKEALLIRDFLPNFNFEFIIYFATEEESVTVVNSGVF